MLNLWFLMSRSVLMAAGVFLCAQVAVVAQDAQMIEDGQPISMSGFLKGCNSDSGAEICEVQGDDGNLYSVVLDDQTPRDARKMLLSAEPNNKVSVEGTMVAHGDVSLNISVSQVKVTKLDPNSPEFQQAQLSGLWKSTDDDQSTMRFSGSDYFDYYNGDAMDEGKISFAATCEDSAADGGGTFFVKTSKDGTEYCYVIENLSSGMLTLMYWPRGNLLNYKMVTEEQQYMDQQ